LGGCAELPPSPGSRPCQTSISPSSLWILLLLSTIPYA
jgi:hypothetical protein